MSYMISSSRVLEGSSGRCMVVVPMGESTAAPQSYIMIPGTSSNVTTTARIMAMGHGKARLFDGRILPMLRSLTYWGGLAVVYVFMTYVILMSPTWRGPAILWALLLPIFGFSLWRFLPSEKRFVEAKSEEIIRLRCGGFYQLGANAPDNGGTA